MKHSRKDVPKDSLEPADPEPEAGDESVNDDGYMGKYADFSQTDDHPQETIDQEALHKKPPTKTRNAQQPIPPLRIGSTVLMRKPQMPQVGKTISLP